MATEMSFLENNGFLAAAAVVVVLQETTVQRLLVRQRDAQVRDDAIIRLRRCRDTIKKLRGRQTSLGHRTDHLDRVLIEIKKDIKHFDRADQSTEPPLPLNAALGSSPLSCGLLTQATIPDQPSPSLVFDDVMDFGNDEAELEELDPTIIDQEFAFEPDLITEAKASLSTSVAYSASSSYSDDSFAHWSQILENTPDIPSS
ncbi:unnamed protein product [Clonostachys rosea]|uniref:Prion-inhibition and propagation HeLo domain-containing protein n=1 Tax=Bionectria ochroleuca TaxID=29856 RepID=A0ABY6UZ63_BIOOC|nr:unnamed protein product [Clonostachys rosea]